MLYEVITYIAALCARIEETLEETPGTEETHLLFSAHGVPKSFIDGGDPYSYNFV